jgi:hypothetical protein
VATPNRSRKISRGDGSSHTGLTGIEGFTEGGAAVLGNAGATLDPDLTSNIRDFGVGTVTHMWGLARCPLGSRACTQLGGQIFATISQSESISADSRSSSLSARPFIAWP